MTIIIRDCDVTLNARVVCPNKLQPYLDFHILPMDIWSCQLYIYLLGINAHKQF
jgi:hypothetical protein